MSYTKIVDCFLWLYSAFFLLPIPQLLASVGDSPIVRVGSMIIRRRSFPVNLVKEAQDHR